VSTDGVFPLVSIGVPIYNEARFLDASLMSLRAQDYPNLEILISDNASTDATFEICERHARDDPRIRVSRCEVNCGAVPNFQRALELASGEFFMWAAGHDLWSPNLVSECVALLRANGQASLAFASSCWIDAQGAPMDRFSGWTDTRGMAPIARLFTIFWGNMHPVLGLMRASRLRACAPMPNLTGGDLVLLCELALRGDFLHAPRALWSRREFRSETSYDDKLKRYASAAARISRSRLQRWFPLLQLPLALVQAVRRSPLTAFDKFAVVLVLLTALPLRYRVGRRSASAG
jgi:glycosyltransferase involved in cell wall biosynthesis